jgi:hypothetical protein
MENVKTNPTEQLIEREEINGTPFHLITQEGKSFIAFGDHMISEPTDNKTETVEKLDNELSTLLFRMTCVVVNRILENDGYKEMLTNYSKLKN